MIVEIYRPTCGDDVCEEGESGYCKEDCDWCGDEECNANETCELCSKDCGFCEGDINTVEDRAEEYFQLLQENDFTGLVDITTDKFQEYYDYWVYRLRPSIMFFFTEKFYTDLSFIYKHTNYKDRRSTEEAGRIEKDHTYIVNSSWYYDLTDNISLSVTYSYSENVSNDPFQKYSGSIISGGIYYSF